MNKEILRTKEELKVTEIFKNNVKEKMSRSELYQKYSSAKYDLHGKKLEADKFNPDEYKILLLENQHLKVRWKDRSDW